MRTFGNPVEAKGIYIQFLLPWFPTYFASKINIQLSVAIRWSQPANQTQNAFISSNLQGKCKIQQEVYEIKLKLVASYLQWRICPPKMYFQI